MPEESHHGDGMALRGVTRPMAMREIRSKESQSRFEMLRMHHKQTLWAYWLLVMLGFWLLLQTFTFSYSAGTVNPSGGREVWLTLSQRATAMAGSDVLSGLLLVVFGWRALRPNRPISLWICCFVGIWLTMAPVIFWSPTAVGYWNSTLIGMLVVGLSILIPGMPNMILYMAHGTTVPKGWSYNPSSWPQRWIMIATGFLGYFASRYLAAYQMGYISFAWDPFFGSGTAQVLNSNVSHALPLSDAALGTFAYTFEFLMGFMGSPQRWRTMPWMVAFFGILVIPLGLTHILLVMSQPVMVGEWCTFCLLAAAIMLPMIPLEVDEVIAMGQFLVQAKRRGMSLWRAFWLGGDVDGEGDDERSPELGSLSEQPGRVFLASIWGMSFPWTLVMCGAVGLGILFLPAALGASGSAADAQHVAGALILTVATIAMGEPVRIVRYANVLLGAALAAGSVVLPEATFTNRVAAALLGLVAAALSLPRGPIRERYGLWQRFIR